MEFFCWPALLFNLGEKTKWDKQYSQRDSVTDNIEHLKMDNKYININPAKAQPKKCDFV